MSERALLRRLLTGCLLAPALACAGSASAPSPAVPTPAPASAPETPAPADAEDAPVDERVALAIWAYDEGRYAEARRLLEELDAAGALDGPLLYRLSFTLGATGDRPREAEVLGRAVATLEQERQVRTDLEIPFYLSNAYRNQGRTQDSRAVAAAATRPFETGERPGPTEALEAFRLGKLYADQDRQEEAARWYTVAVEGFGPRGGSFPAYARWARRHLGHLATARGDLAAAEEHFAALGEGGLALAADWDALAGIRARLRSWTAAAEAWQQAERADPANADRARYARRIAMMAGELGTLPAAAPDGRAWSELTQAELEAAMSGVAARLSEARTEAAASPAPDRPRIEELSREISAARPVFVAAALEYTLRNLPIRETAFVGGYAPLFFQPTAWEIGTTQPGGS